MTSTVYHTSSHTQSRTRPATWVPRRIYYVLAFLKRQLTPGKARAISNRQIQEAIRFGSEGEVSQIMRWLAGELPTAGHWAYKALNQEQVYRFIERERMPNGGYSITLLARPELLAERAAPAPEIVQLSLWDDPLKIPPPADQDAARGGSFSPIPTQRADLAQPNATERENQGDHAKELPEESTKQQQHGARSHKNDWAGVMIAGAEYVPIAALKRAGHTPESVAAADAKIRTRTDLDTHSQARILIAGLLHNQPILDAAEYAQQQESRYERPARSVQSPYAPRAARRSAACAPEPSAERDAEFAAQLAEFQRIADARRVSAV